MKLIPTKPFQNLQNKTVSLDLTVNMFIDDWINNDKKSLENGVLEGTLPDMLQQVSLNMGCWVPIVLMHTGFDDDGIQSYQIIHGSTLLNTLLDYSGDKFDLTQEEREWFGSRKIRVLVYDNLTSEESAAIMTYSDMFRVANDQLQNNGKRLSVLDIEGTVFVEGHK